ncbi:hypothetical protein QYE76_017905 [Lolium multiflorum]|uniref:DDE Tnp4 domain-containing protein n=1 Tax=Lolium multiflorum TaxID=4521 RepID=A0AAD8QFS7_LOLMU|nr:hypothetical protein QYE76_017905 [Lolium multiflorum]
MMGEGEIRAALRGKAFHGRKNYTSQNVVAAMDFDMRFTYVLAGWKSSAHDASIMSDSLSMPYRVIVNVVVSPDLSTNSVLKTEMAVPLSYRPVAVVLPDDEDEHHDMATCSRFILNRVCDLINKRVRVDLGFRKYLKDVAESVLMYCGFVVAQEEIYNHLRKATEHNNRSRAVANGPKAPTFDSLSEPRISPGDASKEVMAQSVDAAQSKILWTFVREMGQGRKEGVTVAPSRRNPTPKGVDVAGPDQPA